MSFPQFSYSSNLHAANPTLGLLPTDNCFDRPWTDDIKIHENIKKNNSFPNQVSPTKEFLLKYLVLENFKVLPCSIKVQHNHKQCQFYHYPKDRKRVGEFYSAELCEYIEKNQICPNGEKCLKSHSCVEQLYRPDKYKTKFCSQYPYNTDNCEYGEFCSFAHNEEEILIELLHRLDKNEDFFMFKFKTVMCPFSSLPHDKAQCVYAHNWQDFRRKPNLFNYSPVSCPNWQFNNYIINYADGCTNSGNCDKCHGWKELDYHPLVYKTKPCPNGISCHRTFECPNYHSEEERRNIDVKVQMNVFRYVPKNRMAVLKKKSETIIASSNNPEIQNKLRKLASPNETSHVNSPPNLQTPKLNPKLPKLASLKASSFPYVSAPKKYEDIFSANLSFNQFYPELATENQLIEINNAKNETNSRKTKNSQHYESNLSTQSHSSTMEASIDFLFN